MCQLSADEDREISDEVIHRYIKVQYLPHDLFKIVIENKKGPLSALYKSCIKTINLILLSMLSIDQQYPSHLDESQV